MELPDDDEAGLGSLGGECDPDELKPKRSRLEEAKSRANVRFWASQDRHSGDAALLDEFDKNPLFKYGEKVRIEQGGEAEWEVQSTDASGNKVSVERGESGHEEYKTIEEVKLA